MTETRFGLGRYDEAGSMWEVSTYHWYSSLQIAASRADPLWYTLLFDVDINVY